MPARPKYKPQYVQQAKTLCAAFGADDKGLAKFFKVSRSAISKWKREHEDFSGALADGKREFDSSHVVASLLKRALGYDIPWEERREEIAPGGKRTVTTSRGAKHIPADTTAIIFYLCNRQGDQWKQRQTLEHVGGEGFGIKVNLTLTPGEPAGVVESPKATKDAKQGR